MRKLTAHGARAHSVLSPSSAQRWFKCPASAMAGKDVADTRSEAAERGELGHQLTEFRLAGEYWLDCSFGFDELTGHALYDSEIEAAALWETNKCMEVVDRISVESPVDIMLERKFSLEQYAPDTFGSCDLTLVTPTELWVIDHKFGQIAVSPKLNKQLMLYALAALDATGYAGEKITLGIGQPAHESFESWETTVTQLRGWAETELKPAVAAAVAPNAPFEAGEHCHFCKIAATCEARKTAAIAWAGEDFDLGKSPVNVPASEFAELYKRGKILQAWLKDLEKHMFSVLSSGAEVEGLKLVRSTGRRVWADTEGASAILKAELFGEDEISETKLLALTKIETLVGKPFFSKYLDPFVTKTEGKLVIAESADKRQDARPKLDAAKDFDL